MFKEPNMWEPAWCYYLSPKPYSKMHILLKSKHVSTCWGAPKITWEGEQTFWAHDEVVNVWSCRHAWTLTALFNHPLWCHHLHMDNLLKAKTKVRVRYMFGQRFPTLIKEFQKSAVISHLIYAAWTLVLWLPPSVHIKAENKAYEESSPGPRCFRRYSSSCLML